MPENYDSAEIAKAYIKFRPAHPSAIVDKILDFLRKNSNNDSQNLFEVMIDVGCGSGQVSNLFTSYFKKIIAIDISPEQVKVGKENNQYKNISFDVGCAENLPASDHSVDLIVAGGAVHWFDLPKFFKEVERVLKPTGCMAMFGCSFEKMSCVIPEKQSDDAIAACVLFRKLMHQGMSEDEHARKSSLEVFQRCVNVFEAVPFTKKLRIDDIFHKVNMSFNDLEGYVKSYDYYENFRKKKNLELQKAGKEISEEQVNLAMIITSKLKEFYGLDDIPNDQHVLTLHVNYFLMLATN